jgi:UDP-3-O-[3-hydroxymyristoyl] glucosamine N-acyltransferase
MVDPRFYRRGDPLSLGDIAKSIGANLANPETSDRSIKDVASLDVAGSGDLSLFYHRRHVHVFAETRAGAVITTDVLSRHARPGMCLLFASDPRLAFAQAGYMFYRPPVLEPAIDPQAHVDSTAEVGPGCRIEAGAIIGPAAQIGPHCHIAGHAVIAEGVVLGAGCRIGANSSISHALIGARVEIGSCCTIGGPGFGFVTGPRGLLRVPQLGRVVIEDDVSIDANCAVDRGTDGDTVIGAGTAIDNLVQIAHNVRVGRHCAIAGQSGIAGSTVIGHGVVIGGQVAISDHLTIGGGARIAFKSAVIRDVEPGMSVGGYPAMPVRLWHRQTAGLARLFGRRGPTAATRLSALDMAET